MPGDLPTRLRNLIFIGCLSLCACKAAGCLLLVISLPSNNSLKGKHLHVFICLVSYFLFFLLLLCGFSVFGVVIKRDSFSCRHNFSGKSKEQICHS